MSQIQTRPRGWRLGLVCLSLPLALAFGCQKEAAKTDTAKLGAGAPSDTAAYRAATAIADTTARIAALHEFLAKYPSTSVFRGGAYARVFALTAGKDEAGALALLEKGLATEKDPAARSRLYSLRYNHAGSKHDTAGQEAVVEAIRADRTPDGSVYGAIAWDLAERKEMLPMALELADVAISKSEGDEKASNLDTKGWVAYQMGDYAQAATLIAEAKGMLKEENPEIDMHLAMAYDKAAMKPQARDLYSAILVTQENPDVRARLVDLSSELDGSPAKALQAVETQRRANAKPMPDVALKDYEGKEHHLSDLKGKVVQINFWHPT